MIKKIITAIFVAIISVVGLSAFAFDSIDWKARVVELRAQHTELKVQVDEGVLTVEEAHEQWLGIMEVAHREKDSDFFRRTRRAGENLEKLADKNPEAAERLRNRISDLEERQQNRIERRMQKKMGMELENGGGVGVQKKEQLKQGDGNGTGTGEGVGEGKEFKDGQGTASKQGGKNIN